MKISVSDRANVGEWILLGGGSVKENKGKIQFGKISKVKVTLENYYEIDFDTNKTRDLYDGYLDIPNKGWFAILNKREVKELVILRNKLKILEGLKKTG